MQTCLSLFARLQRELILKEKEKKEADLRALAQVRRHSNHSTRHHASHFIRRHASHFIRRRDKHIIRRHANYFTRRHANVLTYFCRVGFSCPLDSLYIAIVLIAAVLFAIVTFLGCFYFH